MWQQLVLPVVSYGSEVWGPQCLHFTEAEYFKDNPSEAVHLQIPALVYGRKAYHTQARAPASGPKAAGAAALAAACGPALEQAGERGPRHLAGPPSIC